MIEINFNGTPLLKLQPAPRVKLTEPNPAIHPECKVFTADWVGQSLVFLANTGQKDRAVRMAEAMGKALSYPPPGVSIDWEAKPSPHPGPLPSHGGSGEGEKTEPL